MEGRDHPRQLVQKEYAELGATVSLMLRMCKPIFGSGKAVLLDSGFCVNKYIKNIKTIGIYVISLIKKKVILAESSSC